MDEEDFMKMVDREIREIGDRTMDDFIKKVIIGEGTGEPRGIFSIALDAAALTRIPKEAP